MKTLNRTLIVITPKQPYIDWLKSLEVSGFDFVLENYQNDGGCYLIDETEFSKQSEFKKFIGKNYLYFFEKELCGIEPNKGKWPLVRNLETFNKWFNVNYHSVIVDLSQLPLQCKDL